jgi:hypothetical protein
MWTVGGDSDGGIEQVFAALALDHERTRTRVEGREHQLLLDELGEREDPQAGTGQSGDLVKHEPPVEIQTQSDARVSHVRATVVVPGHMQVGFPSRLSIPGRHTSSVG